MRAAFASWTLVVVAVLPLGQLLADGVLADAALADAVLADGALTRFVGSSRKGSVRQLVTRGTSVPAAAPAGILDHQGRILETVGPMFGHRGFGHRGFGHRGFGDQLLAGGPAGDGGGANVKDLLAIQIGYNDEVTGNTVLLIWAEDTSNPPGLTLSMDANIVAMFDPRPPDAAFPGADAVRVTNVEPGPHAFVLESEDGSFTEADLLVVGQLPVGGVQGVECESGAFLGENNCEVLLRWQDLSPLVDFHYAFIGATPVARLPANISGVIFQGPPGDLCFDLFSVTQNEDGLYATVAQACCTIACQDQPCSDPLDLNVHQSGYLPNGAVDITWRNGEAPDVQELVNGFINDLLVGQLPGDLRNATFTGLPPGDTALGIQAGCGAGGNSGVVTANFNVLATTPFNNPVVDLVTWEYDAAEGLTRVNWENADPALFIEVFVDVAGDPALRTLLGVASPDLEGLNINNTNPDDVPVLQFFTVVDGFCYGSETVVGVPLSGVNRFVRGLCDGRQPAQLLTVVFLFNYLFQNGNAPPCEAACDLDADGGINLVDGLFLLNYLFQNGFSPPSWVDANQDGVTEETCETAPLEQCANGHDFCAM